MRLDGIWRIELEIPAGPREGTVRLTSVGNSFGGQWSDGSESLLFDGGKIEANSVVWSVEAPSPSGPVNIIFAGTVEGDRMSGTVDVGGANSNGLFQGERISV